MTDNETAYMIFGIFFSFVFGYILGFWLHD